jgi:predicted dehydrogenase
MLNIAVTGCGYWGPNLIRNFNQNKSFNMKVACDLDKDRLEYIKELYPGIETAQNFEELLKDETIDAIAIATPVYTHFPLAKLAIEHGKHVLIEKPLASSTKQCLELIKLAKEKKRVLMVGHTFEYTAAVNKAKEIIQSGEIGEVMYISSTRVNLGLFQKDINVIWDLAPHDISIIIYLLGKPPISVGGQGKAHFKEGIEDVANITLNFQNGAIAFINNSWLDPNKIRLTNIVGTKKMLVYDDISPNEKIKIYDRGVEIPPHYDTFGDFQFSYRYGDIRIPRLQEYEPLKVECNHFLECIKENKIPRSDGSSGLRVVSVLEAANHSMKNGGAMIPIKYHEI